MGPCHPVAPECATRKWRFRNASAQSSVGAKANSPRREPWENCDVHQASARGERSRLCHLPPPLGAVPLTARSHGSRRGLLAFALTGWRSVLAYSLRSDGCELLRNPEFDHFYVAHS